MEGVLAGCFIHDISHLTLHTQFLNMCGCSGLKKVLMALDLIIEGRDGESQSLDQYALSLIFICFGLGSKCYGGKSDTV